MRSWGECQLCVSFLGGLGFFVYFFLFFSLDYNRGEHTRCVMLLDVGFWKNFWVWSFWGGGRRNEDDSVVWFDALTFKWCWFLCCCLRKKWSLNEENDHEMTSAVYRFSSLFHSFGYFKYVTIIYTLIETSFVEIEVLIDMSNWKELSCKDFQISWWPHNLPQSIPDVHFTIMSWIEEHFRGRPKTFFRVDLTAVCQCFSHSERYSSVSSMSVYKRKQIDMDSIFWKGLSHDIMIHVPHPRYRSKTKH